MTKILNHFIDGKLAKGQSGRMGDIFNPATGDVTGQVPLASAGEVQAAIASSAAALPSWMATPPARRTQVLFKFRELLIKNMDELANLLSAEHGKTIQDAKGELGRGLEVVEFSCGIPQALKGEYSENVGSNVDSYTIRQPVGVVAGITPFNFPAMVAMWMYPVAIACGNTFVLKPSERDPSVAIRIAELASKAGLPDGVLNVVNGDKEAVDILLKDKRVSAISFVGSTVIGENIYKTGCAAGKRVQALCGAKNHLVVLPDADMTQTTDALMGAGYGSAGERCMAVSVAIAVGADTANELVNRLEPKIRTLKIGPFSDPNSEMGPVISREALDRIKGYVDSGVQAGAKLVVDGRDITVQGHENGYFIGGCLFDNVTPDMSIYKDEIFGPVLAIVRVNDYEEALRLVNDHEYGNGAAIFTRDGDAARDFSSRAKIGMIGINVPIPVPVAYHSFGGWKRSLFGDHHIHGMEGVRFYTRLKTMTTRWPSGIKDGAEFHFKRSSDH
jgi:malonate-semialdehyde dehydrogenase (acetylating) / methylmalonate-semialdehyde dehydrogenase